MWKVWSGGRIKLLQKDEEVWMVEDGRISGQGLPVLSCYISGEKVLNTSASLERAGQY